MKRNLLIASLAGSLFLGTGALQTAQAQHHAGVMRVSSGHHWGVAHGGFYHGGCYGGGWGWGPGAVLGGVAALATAPFWLLGGGFAVTPYSYDYDYVDDPAAYGVAPVYFKEPAYVVYAPRRVVYTTRAVRARHGRPVRYAHPRRAVVVHRAAYRGPMRAHARPLGMREGVRHTSARVIAR